MPTCYELWQTAIDFIATDERVASSRDAQKVIYLGVASQALARIADALEGSAKNGTAMLDEARTRISNLGFCENADYLRGVGDAVAIIDGLRTKEEKDNAAD